jgi:hypothetical protein
MNFALVWLFVVLVTPTVTWRSLMLLLQVLYHKSCYIQILQANNLVDVHAEHILTPSDNRTRGNAAYRTLHTNGEVYRYSFFPRSIINHLEHHTTNSTWLLLLLWLFVVLVTPTVTWRSLMLLLQVLYHKSCYIQILQLSFVLPLVGPAAPSVS